MIGEVLPAVEIIGHRGASFEAPENTLASFKRGWNETQTVELDVWPTSDGKLLVIHDENTKRTTGVDRCVPDHPLTELRQLDAGSFKGAKWSAEKLPSLQDVLTAIPPGRKLLIEIKTGPEVIAELRREVDTSGTLDQILIHSFDYAACAEAKKVFPQTEVNLLGEWKLAEPSTGPCAPLAELIQQAKAAHLNGLSLANKPFIGARTIRQIHEAELKASFWTVDDPVRAKALINAGADAIITNRPGWMIEQLGNQRTTSGSPAGA